MEKESFCRFCQQECGVKIVYSQQGKPLKLRFTNSQTRNWCPTGQNALELINSPQRLTTPLRSVGALGENKWEPISWEDAISTIASKLNLAKQNWGAESIIGIRGYNKPFGGNMFARFCNVLGLPNVVGAGNICHAARNLSWEDTFGFTLNNLITPATKTIILWGCNPKATLPSQGYQIEQGVEAGSRLVVVDPCLTSHAQKADLWLPIKPGQDMALALGLINLIIAKGWWDKEFVAKHTVGFEQLKAEVKDYNLALTARLTGLEEESILALAKSLAVDKPALIISGNAIDQNHDSYQKGRALAILIGITGNVDLPGGALANPAKKADKNPLVNGSFKLGHLLTKAEQEKKLGGIKGRLKQFTMIGGQDVVRAINTQKPYPIKAAFVVGGNPVLGWADSVATTAALAKLDFLMVADYFLTPTAKLAHVVLPVATYLEADSVVFAKNGNIHYCPALVKTPNVKTDGEILNEIGKAMGLTKYFWQNIDGYWDEVLAPYGLTMAKLKELGTWENPTKTQTGVVFDYRAKGFPTSTGKVNLFSGDLAAQQIDPLPSYQPMPLPTAEYPYLCTNYKPARFYHSAGRQIEAQRGSAKAVALVSLDVAQKEDLQDGDMVEVFTSVGKARQEVKVVSGMAAGTVALAHGWWYPELDEDGFSLSASANNLTPYNALEGKPIPSFSLRGLICGLKKIE